MYTEGYILVAWYLDGAQSHTTSMYACTVKSTSISTF